MDTGYPTNSKSTTCQTPPAASTPPTWTGTDMGKTTTTYSQSQTYAFQGLWLGLQGAASDDELFRVPSILWLLLPEAAATAGLLLTHPSSASHQPSHAVPSTHLCSVFALCNACSHPL
eukprot:1160369-Pelagomonas_calceolata.AAC.4